MNSKELYNFLKESIKGNLDNVKSDNIKNQADALIKTPEQMKKELIHKIPNIDRHHSYYDYYYIDLYEDLPQELITNHFYPIGFPNANSPRGEKRFDSINKICVDRRSYIVNKNFEKEMKVFGLFSPTESTGFYDGYVVLWENLPFEVQTFIYEKASRKNLNESVGNNIDNANSANVTQSADEKILPKITKAEKIARRYANWLRKDKNFTEIHTEQCLGPEWNACKGKNKWFFNVMESSLGLDYHYITEILLRHSFKSSFFTLKVSFNSNPKFVKDNSILKIEIWIDGKCFDVPIVNGEYAFPSSPYYTAPNSTADIKTLSKIKRLVARLTSEFDAENYKYCAKKTFSSKNRNDVWTGYKNGLANYLYNTNGKKYIG